MLINRIQKYISEAFTRIIIAIQFLTMLPVGFRQKPDAKTVTSSIIFFPFAGIFIGIIGIIVNVLLRNIAFDLMRTFFVISTMIAVTGGLHLDGYIEIVETFLKENPHRYSIHSMKENILGPFGIIYLASLIILKFIAFNNIAENFKNIVLIIFPMLSRWAMGISIVLLEKDKNTSGTGIDFFDFIGKKEFFVIGLIPVIIAIIFFKLIGLIMIGVVVLFTYIFTMYIEKKHHPRATKDIFGAVNEIVELLVLVFLATAYK
ncbi:adenosylcobinamide-GDP ribazoletransferase [Candidatus Poribacteria bacterium]|nr:adenosylcobinamide-GDP ribazoletransferase [Candidatus Poribacteria bacterium]